MSRDERIALIKDLQAARQSLVLTYVTSTRPGLSVQMAMDVVRLFYDHLQRLSPNGEKLPAIDLLIHSDGGDGTVPWRLVPLIREFTDKFSVLVPHRAFSAATLTALGADEIVMHPMGMLGPIDPTVTNPFNPADPRNPNQKIGISVEDVSAYISLIKEDAGIRHEDELVQAFNMLASQVHPLALGNVKRFQIQSRMMARKMLQLHMDKTDDHRMDEIAENLSAKLYFHGHPINRTEAKNELNLKVAKPDRTVETMMWNLYSDYERELEMQQPFDLAQEFLAQQPNPPTVIPPQGQPMQPQGPGMGPIPGQMLLPGHGGPVKLPTYKLVVVESEFITDTRIINFEVNGSRFPNGSVQVETTYVKEEWLREQ